MNQKVDRSLAIASSNLNYKTQQKLLVMSVKLQEFGTY